MVYESRKADHFSTKVGVGNRVLRAEVSVVRIQLLVDELSLTMTEAWDRLVVNWTGWDVVRVFALYWVANNSVLVVYVGGVGSAVDRLVELLLLDLPLGVMDGVYLRAVYWLGLIGYQPTVVRHERLQI